MGTSQQEAPPLTSGGCRAQRSSVSRSSSVSAKGGIGRPMRMRVLLSTGRTLTAHTLFQPFQTHETSRRLKKAHLRECGEGGGTHSTCSHLDLFEPPAIACRRV